jgi:hypothetical protein
MNTQTGTQAHAQPGIEPRVAPPINLPMTKSRDDPTTATQVVTLQQVLARLDESRESLRVALTPVAQPASDGKAHAFHPVRRVRAWLRTTPWGALLDPVFGTVSNELEKWWQGQSWRGAAVAAKDAVAAELVPLVRRYPIASVLVTAAAGALVAGSGVWRWRTLRRTAAQLAVQVKRMGVSQLTNPALQSLLLGALLSYFAPKRKAAAANANAEPGPRQTGVEGADGI